MKVQYKIILVLACIIVASLYLLNPKIIKNPSPPEVSPPVEKEEEVPIIQEKPLVDKIKVAVNEYIQENKNNIGLCYYDLVTKENFSINGDNPFRSASISKLFTVMYGYEQLHLGHINKDDIIYCDMENDYEEGTGILQYGDLSQPQTIEYLLQIAITHSDNIAYHMLMRYLGAGEIFNYYKDIVGHLYVDEYIEMSPMDTQKLLLKIVNDPIFNKLKQDMNHSVFDDRIAHYLPKEIVSHKIGNYGSVVHDAAIIETDKPYILIIFTDNLDNAYEQIAKISKIIYDIKIT